MHITHLLFVALEFVIILGIMVLVHEFGHFAVAKLCGVRIETFSIGFGKRLFGINYGGTDYRISLLPLGGYVKMAGEMGGDTVAAPDDFTSKPRWQRVMVALAGPFSNFLLSFFLLTLVAHYHHEVDQYLNGPAVVDYVPQNTPAARDGLSAGDTIVSFNGVPNPTWDQVLREMEPNLNNHAVAFSFSHAGQVVSSSIDMAPAGGLDFAEEGPAAIGLIPREQPACSEERSPQRQIR